MGLSIEKRPRVGNKLLIVDDDRVTRLLIRNLLEESDISVLESDCANKAYELFKNSWKEIGMILLDIRLPDYDGWTLAKLIRRLDPFIPILAISAILPAELAKGCQATGFTGYITKPFEIKQLKEIILSLLKS